MKSRSDWIYRKQDFEGETVKRRFFCALAVVVLWIGISDAQQSPTEIIVKMKPGQDVGKAVQVAGGQIRKQIDGQSIYLIQVDDSQPDFILQRYTHSPGVESAELNNKVRMESTTEAPVSAPAGAQLVQSMAALLDSGATTMFYGTEVLKAYSDQAALQLIGASDSRQLGSGAGVRVAYIDTGVDPDHPVLQPWLDPGIDVLGNGEVSEFDGMPADMAAWFRGTGVKSRFDGRFAFFLHQSMAALLDQSMAALLDQSMAALLDQSMAALLDGSGSPPGAVPPAFGHGTLVAGAIHAVAPQARIVPIRAFDAAGNSDVFKLTDAIYRAADAGVDVLNMSFSTRERSQIMQRAVAYAQSMNVEMVASAGNEGRDMSGVYPASWGSVCAVAATDFYDRLASFSNYGLLTCATAPGAYVVTTAPGGRYALAWGTSFSAPLVAGSIAVVASTHARGFQDTAVVVTTADSIDELNPGFATYLGHGRVNLSRALQRSRR
jgi:subtilisin family serine protease